MVEYDRKYRSSLEEVEEDIRLRRILIVLRKTMKETIRRRRRRWRGV